MRKERARINGYFGKRPFAFHLMFLLYITFLSDDNSKNPQSHEWPMEFYESLVNRSTLEKIHDNNVNILASAKMKEIQASMT